MDAPNDVLTGQFPRFSTDGHADELAGYLARRIDTAAPYLVEAFEQGHYQQDRSFVRHIGRQILDPDDGKIKL